MLSSAQSVNVVGWTKLLESDCG